MLTYGIVESPCHNDSTHARYSKRASANEVGPYLGLYSALPSCLTVNIPCPLADQFPDGRSSMLRLRLPCPGSAVSRSPITQRAFVGVCGRMWAYEGVSPHRVSPRMHATACFAEGCFGGD
jgi:hypothetical protein